MNQVNLKKTLSPAYRKYTPLRNELENFRINLKECLDTIKFIDEKNESEEHLKDPIKVFLKNTFYKDHLINTKDNIDLAIYLGEKADSNVGVLIEAKKPSNKYEFLSESNINKKALHELLLYYLKERVDGNNNNIKHLIASNGYEWFLFKAEDFYNYFYKNSSLIKEYKAFRNGLKDTSKNELFYNEIAKKYISEVEDKLPYLYLDFTQIDLLKLSDAKLNTYFKIFSDVHLLGHNFGNDSNQLNKSFYNELLHIIGLEEILEKGKKIIYRKESDKRDYSSLLENTIFNLESRDFLSKAQEINKDDDRDFNVGLQLCLTWINRILFLKLLESQLLNYHQNSKEYKFLNEDFIDGFDGINDLFFSALAVPEEKRHPKFHGKFRFIPYLNSSLFERNKLERETFEIGTLKDEKMEVYPQTILKDQNGRRLKGKLDTLSYLFRFLDAYDFSTDAGKEVEEGYERKSLINASVLGLIFEKINGYKEGSFYTPGYITMHMARETIRKKVVEKFQEIENRNIESFQDVKAYCHNYFKSEDTHRFNEIINSLKICDPAVGSGHFLVSALNELIAIKNELGILNDLNGLRLPVEIHVDNDELFVIKSNGDLFEYQPKDKETHEIQKALFHQKQILIENCLFGVDINPNSVKICRLRLWIELLKNSYYTDNKTLKTLPNIDINIKCGNSLISRFSMEDDLKAALRKKQINYNFTDYKKAVSDYKNTNSKTQKAEVLNIINEIKSNFQTTLDNKFLKKFHDAQRDYSLKKQQLQNLRKFGERITKKEKDTLEKLKIKAEKEFIKKEEIVNNVIYNNAFEWRFEFPEVLNDKGDFIGFDVIIGNPPYAVLEKKRNSLLEPYKDILDYSHKSNRYIRVLGGKLNLYRLFIHLANEIGSVKSKINFIIPLTLMGDDTLHSTRSFVFSHFKHLKFDCFPQKDIPSKRIFEDAKQSTLIISGEKSISESYNKNYIEVNTYPFKSFEDDFKRFQTTIEEIIKFDDHRFSIPLVSEEEWSILKKIHKNEPIRSIPEINVRRGEINQTIYRKYINENTNHSRLIKGVEIGPFKLNEILSQGKRENFDEETFHADGKINTLSRERRIGTQRITGVDERLRIVAAIIQPVAYLADSTNSISCEEPYSLEVLLGFFNSKLFQWRFKKTSSNNNVGTTELESLPMKYCGETFKEIENLVIKLIEPELSERNSTIEKLNRVIYSLYDLNSSEIEVIECS